MESALKIKTICKCTMMVVLEDVLGYTFATAPIITCAKSGVKSYLDAYFFICHCSVLG